MASERQPLMQVSSQTRVHVPDRDRILVIMAKAPRLGMVKTRLAQSLPPPAVTALYRCLLADTVALARSLNGVEIAIMCPGTDRDELERLLAGRVPVIEQRGQGLGAALTSVFAHFATAWQRVIAFNSDSPHIPASILEGAFQTLSGCDVVVGPSHDGGYYLVGAKADHPTLFEGDGMGTTNALDALLARTRTLGLSTGFSEPFYDIDVADDLVQLAVELRLAPGRAPETATWFVEWEPAVAQLRARTGKL